MENIVQFLFAGQNIAFLVAGIAVFAILAFELIAILVGASLHALHADADFDLGKDLGGALDWLNPGHVPLIILLTLFLGLLSVAGFTGQWLISATGLPLLHPLMATPLASVIVLPFVRGASSLFSRILPKETTNAIEVDSLAGYYGELTLGPINEDMRGQAKFKDDHGTTHYLTVVTEPGTEGAQVGQQVVLLGRLTESYNVFVVRSI